MSTIESAAPFRDYAHVRYIIEPAHTKTERRICGRFPVSVRTTSGTPVANFTTFAGAVAWCESVAAAERDCLK